MKNAYALIVFFLTACTMTISAQAGLERANKQYESFAYVDAIKTYERLAEKGYKSADMFQKLGNAYYFNADLPQAAKWYGELFKLKGKIAPEYYYRYAQALKSAGQYDEADQLMSDFVKMNAEDSRAKLFKNETDYMAQIIANSNRYNISDAGINSEYSDYGSAVVGDILIFTSARDTGTVFARKHKWTNQSFTNMYQATITGDSVGNAQKFAKNINLKFHESTPTFTRDGKTMYFTRNNFAGGKKGKNGQRITLLKIYKSTYDDNTQQWSDAVELPFNSDNYNTAHPALSPDDKTLYFASDMPGTKGQSDIFMVSIADNSFGKPQNLTSVNTEGRETFPFVSADNHLYFATDGHPGLGGLDIFMAKLDHDKISDIQNIGSPVNSPTDDFGFYIDSATRKGFFTSNRPGGVGNDDIYKFTETRKLVCEQLLTGLVTDAQTKQILPNTRLTFSDANMKVLSEITSDISGAYQFKVTCGDTYYIKAQKETYSVSEKKVVIAANSGETKQDLELERTLKQVAVGDDLAKLLDIKVIYFDRDKSEIRDDAAFELEKILDVMQQYPAMRIDVRSHTDSRQTHQYNEGLSDRRAKSTIQWLISQGIAADRLTGKGYGETRLLNKCSNGVECTEEEHQLNRRSEFIIISLQ